MSASDDSGRAVLNKITAKSKIFYDACNKLANRLSIDVSEIATKRQASKFRRKKGRVYQCNLS